MFILIILLHIVITQNAPQDTEFNCKKYQNYTYDQSWVTIELKKEDVVIIQIFGSLAQIGLLIVLCTYLFIKQSRQPPGQIFMLLSFFNFLSISSQMASAIYVQRHRQYQLAPSDWEQFCFTTGIINIIGRIGVNIYNILFCVYIWISIRNTLKPHKQTYYHYHAFCLLIIVLFALFFYLTDNIGVGVNGICSTKMNLISPYISFCSFLFYLFIACTTLSSFKKHVPNIRILKMHRRQFIVFFSFYLIINSILTAAGSITIIVFQQICVNQGVLNPGIFGTIINIIQILQGLIVVYIRLRHPLIKSHLFKLINSLLGRINNGHTYIYNLTQSIRMYHIYNFLSAVRISYKQAPVRQNIIQLNYSLRLDNRLMRKQLGDHYLYQQFRMPQLKITFYCCTFFKRNNRYISDPYQSLAIQYNTKALQICSSTDGGKSGQFFFISQDSQFILKTVKIQQINVYLKRASSFAVYFEQRNPKSIIVRFVGVFTIKYKVADVQICILLMPNLKRFQNVQILRTYDLKGSRYKRQVLEQFDFQTARTKTLKDIDFINYQKKVYLQEQVAAKVKQILLSDVRLLSSLGLMDYSLLVVKIRSKYKPQVQNQYSVLKSSKQKGIYYILGIIDYLQTWNLQKYSELHAKKVLTSKKVDAGDISAQQPIFYRDRFIKNVIEPFFDYN